MLKILLVTTTIFLSFSLIGQDQAYPVFVSTANLDLLEKESAEFAQRTKDLKMAQINGDNQAIQDAQAQMNKLLDKVVFRSQFIDPQVASHMDLDNVRKLKQEWVDGIGFKYYINLEKFRNTPGLTEIQLTEAQYEDYVASLSELKALQASFEQKSLESPLAISENLIKANEIVNSRKSLLVQ